MSTNCESLNTLFPGHRNGRGEFDYQGPTSGWFSLLHHGDDLVEWSDNVMKRVQYIVSHKPADEQALRLRHIVYLGEIGADYNAKHESLYAGSAYDLLCAKAKRAPLDAEIIDYIKPLIDGFAWNGKELVMSTSQADPDGP